MEHGSKIFCQLYWFVCLFVFAVIQFMTSIFLVQHITCADFAKTLLLSGMSSRCLQGLGISKHNYVASEHLGSGGAGYVLNKISVCQLVLSSFPTQSSSKSTNNCPIEMGIWLNRIQNDCQCHHG